MKINRLFKNKKYRSLRSLLISWFFIFSFVPLLFIGWYSVSKFEEAFDLELLQRLQGNGREVENIVGDYFRSLQSYRNYFSNNSQFQLNFAEKNIEGLNTVVQDWIGKTPIHSIVFYDSNGQMLSSIVKNNKNELVYFQPINEKILLNEKYLSNLNDKKDFSFVEYKEDKVSLIMFSKILSKKNDNLGYVEQTIDLKEIFVNRIKNRLKIEAAIVDNSGKIILSSNKLLRGYDFTSYKVNQFIDLEINSQSHGFVIYPVPWERSQLNLILGTQKKDVQGILKNVNIAFITVLSIVGFFLFLTIFISTNVILRPVNNLIEGFRSFENNDGLVQIPVTTHNEIGLLTVAFNDMSARIFEVRTDLKKKIKELENTNKELVETQTKLVHSAKMTSLGQLVAGVAHELNNPIGFIFSNMTILKDYSENLFKIIDTISLHNTEVNKLKEEVDYEFLKKDLPKLIKSCQDGAQRTRDIVRGLRNFSRLEEAQLKEININESIDTTLEILKVEIKNRIQIHKNYDELPLVNCYASQINQVLMNIISNSIHAINGQGQIWITTSKLIDQKNDLNSRVQISIQDSGIGMDKEILEKIFEPFFTTKGVGQGTGLGLSISYGIIQNHGGEIQVRSQRGVGTEFVIILPVRPVFNTKS